MDAQQVPDGAGRTREPGLGGDLSIGHHVPWFEPLDHGAHPLVEPVGQGLGVSLPASVIAQGQLRAGTELEVSVRDGDIVIPRLEPLEPLREQLAHFIDCIITGSRPLTSAEDGVAIVRILEWAERELGPAARAETTPA